MKRTGSRITLAVAFGALLGTGLCEMTFAFGVGASKLAPASSIINPGPGDIVGIGARTIDGTGNNIANPTWGSTHTRLRRLVPHAYEDGISSPAILGRPSPRAVSSMMCEQLAPVWNTADASDWVWQWGQFIDHDLDLTEGAVPEEDFDIVVPQGDPWFDPGNTGTEIIHFIRSEYDITTGTDPLNPRQQRNAITAYLDGSMVYGANATRAMELREFNGSGRLKTSPGDLLPFNVNHFPNAGGTSETLFLAGDVRSNEQTGLAAIHTLWVREHNRYADQISAGYPFLTEELIYQLARIYVIAEIQVITFEEFLPIILGPNAIPEYTTYDPSIDPSISNVFSTACYRFGHTMLPENLLRLDAAGQEIPDGHLPLAGAFFAPERITDEGGLEPIYRGLASQRAQEVDPLIQDSIRNFLFGPPGAGGFDLPALNIQRGRDHGLPTYNEVRLALGLVPAATFADVTSNPVHQAALQAAYGDVNDIDVWLGGLAEDHLPDAMVGELLYTVIREQFLRLRDGDRLWYERIFPPYWSNKLSRIQLSDVIRANTSIDTEIEDDVFRVKPLILQCAADIEPAAGDGIVDINDLVVLLNNLGSQNVNADIAPNRAGAHKGDGVVNQLDLIAVLEAFGPCPTN
jgi:hypothetical protein